jgi:hypothetical protein
VVQQHINKWVIPLILTHIRIFPSHLVMLTSQYSLSTSSWKCFVEFLNEVTTRLQNISSTICRLLKIQKPGRKYIRKIGGGLWSFCLSVFSWQNKRSVDTMNWWNQETALETWTSGFCRNRRTSVAAVLEVMAAMTNKGPQLLHRALAQKTLSTSLYTQSHV